MLLKALLSNSEKRLLIDLYREFSEEKYAASFINATPETVFEFREWLADYGRDPVDISSYEQELIREFLKQESAEDEYDR